MPEVPPARENHRRSSFVDRLHRKVVADRAAWLDDHADPRVGGELDAIWKREVRIRRQRRALQVGLAGLLESDPD